MFSINPKDLPRLNNYSAASTKYHSITPIRGSTVRPLESRTKQHFSINLTTRQGLDGLTYQAIGCRLYNSDVVVYLSNGEIHFDNHGFVTPSTHAFANAILPFAVQVQSYRDSSMVSSNSWCSAGVKPRVKVQDDASPVVLHPLEVSWIGPDLVTDPVAIHNPTTPYNYYLRCKLMTVERRRAKPFIEFCNSMALVLGPQSDSAHSWSVERWTQLRVSAIYEAIGDDSQWADTAKFLLGRSLDRRTGVFNMATAKELIMDAIKFHKASELIERREMDTFPCHPMNKNEECYKAQFWKHPKCL